MKNRAVIVTGASSGIGKSLVEKLASAGVTVFAASRRTDAAEKLKEQYPDSVIPIKLDVADTESISAFAKQLDNYEISGLVNNAGITSFTKAEKDDPVLIKNIIDTNLLGAIFVTKAVLPIMIEQKYGKIINTGSVVAEKVFTKSSAYSASKSGLIAYMKVLREEVRNYNIQVTNVLPGATQTAIWADEAIEKFGNRMMKVEDVAEVLYKICLDNSSVVYEEVVLRPSGGDL